MRSLILPILTFFAVSALLFLYPVPPANAGNAPVGGGGTCGVDAGSQTQAFNDGLYTCSNGSTWQSEAFIVGSVMQDGTSPSCNSTNAGMLQWTGSVFQGCNGSSWGSLASGGSTALSGLLAATTTNSIDSTNWAQTWKWGTLSTQTALTFTTSSMTTGTLLALSNTSTPSNAGTVLSVSNGQAGASYGINVTNSGTANTGYAGYFANTGTNAVNYGLYASTSSTTGYAIYANGNITATTLTLTSDTRAKSDIVALQSINSLENIARLRPVAFTWKTSKRADMGFIAQEVETVYPNVVSRNPDGNLSLEYTALTAPIVSAIQQLTKQFADLAAANRDLASKFARIEAENKDLRQQVETDRVRLDALGDDNTRRRNAIDKVSHKREDGQ